MIAVFISIILRVALLFSGFTIFFASAFNGVLLPFLFYFSATYSMLLAFFPIFILRGGYIILILLNILSIIGNIQGGLMSSSIEEVFLEASIPQILFFIFVSYYKKRNLKL